MIDPAAFSRRSVLAAAVATAAACLVRTSFAGSEDKSFEAAEKAIVDAIEKRQCPGAVLCIGRKSGVIYTKAFGNRAVEPEKVAMTPDTAFDLASLTKPTATSTSIMLLAERGELSFTDPVIKYFPDFAANDKSAITIEDLLLHRSGLIPDNNINEYKGTRDEMLKTAFGSKLKQPTGKGFLYSDLNFITLGEIVRVASGKAENEFVQTEVFQPLGMKETMYLPNDSLKPRCAPTEKRDGHWMIGEVHDPRAYALGGVAGHAGLFSTASDLSRFCRMILGKGELDGARVLKEETVAKWTEPHWIGDEARAYGFDVATPYSSPRGNRFPKGKSFGHTGFTGTSYWIDPVDDVFVILLTNSVHPDGKGKVIQLRREVATAVADVLLPKA